MKRCALTWLAFATFVAVPVSAQDTMGLWIDPDGSTYIKNLSATKTFSIQDYSIFAQQNDLLAWLLGALAGLGLVAVRARPNRGS